MSPLTLLNVQAAVVILGPLALGWWLRSAPRRVLADLGMGQRSRSSCRCWRGASFLYILAFLLTPLVRIAADSPAVFWINLLVLSLTAGLFVETARWLMLRRFAPAARGWRNAVMFGAGHGGIEAILLVGGSTIWGIVLLQLGDNLMAQTQSVQERVTMGAQLDALYALRWWDSALVVWERVAAVTFHIGAAVCGDADGADRPASLVGGRRRWPRAVQRYRPRGLFSSAGRSGPSLSGPSLHWQQPT